MKYLILLLLFIPFLVVAQPEFDKAEKQYQNGQISQARILFENVVKENPNHLKSLEYL
jgi:hypothetical protein